MLAWLSLDSSAGLYRAVVAAWHWSLRALTARGDLTWVLPAPAAMMQGQGRERAAVHISRQAVVVVFVPGADLFANPSAARWW